jgi:MFS family permease
LSLGLACTIFIEVQILMCSFADAYQFFAVAYVITIMSPKVYGTPSEQPGETEIMILISASIGAVFGQLAFGLLADKFGRKKVSCLTTALTR